MLLSGSVQELSAPRCIVPGHKRGITRSVYARGGEGNHFPPLFLRAADIRAPLDEHAIRGDYPPLRIPGGILPNRCPVLRTGLPSRKSSPSFRRSLIMSQWTAERFLPPDSG